MDFLILLAELLATHTHTNVHLIWKRSAAWLFLSQAPINYLFCSFIWLIILYKVSTFSLGDETDEWINGSQLSRLQMNASSDARVSNL